LNSLAIFAFMLTACGGGGGGGGSASSQPVSYTYSTTSSKGDYSEWTFTGNHLNAIWDSITTAGDIAYTTTIDATCVAEDSFGRRACTIDTIDCVNAAETCPTTTPTNLIVREVPGVALFVAIPPDTQLHVGFAKDSTACSQDVSGDYTIISTGISLKEIFGMLRSDNDLINILQSNFGFDSPMATSTPATETPAVTYLTSAESKTFGDEGCSDGIRVRRNGTNLIRAMITHSGLVVMDYPAGQGGAVGFKTANAASLTDFAGKSFSGISFRDLGESPQYVNADFSAVSSDPVSGDLVTMDVTIDDGTAVTTGTTSLMPLTTASTATDPAFPDFSIVPPGYDTSMLATDYPSPVAIPGMFKVDITSDTARVLLAAMRYHGKAIAIGSGYNWRTTGEISSATGLPFTSNGLFNSGNFILFER